MRIKKLGMFLLFCCLTAGMTGVFYWAMDNQDLPQWVDALLEILSEEEVSEAEGEKGAQVLGPISSELEPLWIVSSDSEDSVSNVYSEPSIPWNVVVVGPESPMEEGYEQVILPFQGIEVDSRIVQPLKDMLEAAQKDGISLSLFGSYISPEKDTDSSALSSKNTALSSSVANESAESSQHSGFAGRKRTVSEKSLVYKESEHATGLAVDFSDSPGSFYQSEEYTWLLEHGPEYGFVLRYPWGKERKTGVFFAPHHFRYVGKAAAEEMKKEGLCLEEYVSRLEQREKR